MFVSAGTVFSLAATDQGNGVAQIEYRVDNNNWGIYREPFRISDEGVHRLEYRSVDNLGNLEPEKVVLITVDNTPPLTAISADNRSPDSSDSITVNRAVTVTLDPYDRLSGAESTEYRIDQGKWIRYAPFTVEGNAPHVVSFRSIDNVGNQEQAKSVTIKIDKVPPVSVISVGEPHISAANGSYVVSEITFFTISAKDALSPVERTEYRIDNTEWKEYQPFTIPGEGRHLVEYRSRDRAGNIESPRRLVVTVITTPPTTGISVNGKPRESGATISSTLPFSVTAATRDAGGGIRATEYRLNGSSWIPYKPFTVSDEGEHVVEVRSTDKLGNTETTRFVKLLIDRSPPHTELVIGEPKRVENGTLHITDKTVLALFARDPLSGVAKSEYVIEGTGELTGSEPFTILTAGQYRIRYWSVDMLGNREKERRMPVVVEVAKPPVHAGQATVVKPASLSAPPPVTQGVIGSVSPPATITDTPNKKDMPGDQAIPPELREDPFFTPAGSLLPDAGDPEQNRKFFTTGGINAAIITIIMLLL